MRRVRRQPAPSLEGASRILFWAVLTSLIPALGCDGCLDLDEYRLVPAGYAQGGSGGGTGGSPPSCQPGGERGQVWVAVPLAPGQGESSETACDALAATNAAIDVLWVDAWQGDCAARARIDASASATLSSVIRTGASSDGGAVVAARFGGGSLTFPVSCNQSSTPTVTEEPGATDTIVVGKLRLVGGVPCTDWVAKAWTTGLAPLGLETAELGTDGSIAIGGSLGGGALELGTGSIQGGAFWIRFANGSVVDSEVLQGSADDAVLGARAVDGRWLITGTLLHEQPSCHQCVGNASVINAASACQASGGAGGAGGTGGAGTGGAGTGGAGTGGALPDTHNAMLWHKASVDPSCARFGTFGSDRNGPSDVQLGYSASALLGSDACTTYFAGLAGTDAWRFVDAQPESSLYDAGSTTLDGFVARLDGTDVLDCGTGAAHTWNLRLTPSIPGAVAWGNRAVANRCNPGAAVTAFVRGAVDGTLAVHRCQAGSCTANEATVELVPGPDAHLVVMGLASDGTTRWRGAFGPVDIPARAIGGLAIGGAADNLALDGADNVVIAVQTSGTMRSQNVNIGSCAELELGAPPGSYLIGLDLEGVGNEARCGWVRQLAR